MVATFKRIINSLFPHLSAGYDLPMLAEVVAIPDAPKKEEIANGFRPHYAVDVQLLKPGPRGTLVHDTAVPVYSAVPLPVMNGGGNEQGLFGFPQVGTVVELAFAYGKPDLPMIRGVYSHDLTVPSIDTGELRWQHSTWAYQRADQGGNWQRHSYADIHDKSQGRKIEAVTNTEQYGDSLREVKGNELDVICGQKVIEALGALGLLSGDVLDLTALGNIDMISGADINAKASRDLKIIVGGNADVEIVGNAALAVGGDVMAEIGGDVLADVGGNVDTTIGGNFTATVAGAANITATASTHLTTAQLTVDCPASTFTGLVTVQGLLSMLGGFSAVPGGGGAAGSMTGNLNVNGGDVVVDGVSVKTHTHPGDSGGNTGTPN